MALVNQFRILVYWFGGAVVVWIIAYLIGKIRKVMEKSNQKWGERKKREKDQRRE